MIDIERLAREASPFTHESMFADKELIGILHRFSALVRNEVLEEAAQEGWMAANMACEDRVKAAILALKDKT